MKTNERIRRGGVELVVIVVGVLIALAVDNWWAGQNDRASERAYLAALYSDVLADSLEYESVVRVLDRAIASSAAVIEVVERRRDFDDPAEGVRTVFCASFLPLPVLSRATVEDLLSTGGLQLVRDRRLRTSLLDYHARVSNEFQWSDEYRDNQARYRERMASARFFEVAGTRFDAVTQAEYQRITIGLRDQAGVVAALNGMLFAQRRVSGFSQRLIGESGSLLATLRSAMESAGADPESARPASAPSSGMPVDQTCPAWSAAPPDP